MGQEENSYYVRPPRNENLLQVMGTDATMGHHKSLNLLYLTLINSNHSLLLSSHSEKLYGSLFVGEDTL